MRLFEILIYEELGAVQGRDMFDPEEFVRVEGDEGKILILHTDIDRLEQHLKELSPADAGMIEEFCNAARRLARFEMPVDKPMELMGLFDKLKMLTSLPVLQALGKYGKISLRDFAAGFRDPFLRKAFEQISTLVFEPECSASGLMSAMAFYHARNAGLPISGSLEFARAIERRYLDLGGEVRYKARVEKILVEEDRAVGVRLSDGTEHRADIVISAADGRTTIFDMLEGKYVNDTIRSYYDEWPVYGPGVYVSLGVARDLANEAHSLIFPFKEPLTVAGDVYNGLHVKHYSYDPNLAPAGKSVMIVFFPKTSYEYWNELYKDRERYKAEKRSLADAVIARLEERFAGITAQVEVVDVATPMTYVRYTGNWQGSFMGWLGTPQTMSKSMSRTLPGLGSFYMAGQWVYMGGGIPGAVMSGRHLMQVICKGDRKQFVTTLP